MPTSVLLHAAAAILLFQVLWRMTGNRSRHTPCAVGLWPAAFVAAVFAIHPLRAESVAWVSERKDVLSGLFFMLTLAAYLGYVRHPFSIARYAALLLAFALGLMCQADAGDAPLRAAAVGLLAAGTNRSRHTPCAVSRTAAAATSKRHNGLCLIRGLVVEKIPLFLAGRRVLHGDGCWPRSKSVITLDTHVPWRCEFPTPWLPAWPT